MGLVLLEHFILEPYEHCDVEKSKLYEEATWKRSKLV